MKRQFFFLLPLFTLLLTACASLSPASPTPLATGLSGMVSGKVDVGGYALYYTCAGEGSPTVILEAGGPADSTMWELVMLYYQGYTRICAYDRANLGNSDSVPKPRTLADMTRDLHALLENTPIEGPYILAGQSMGGMLVRLYASQYPEDVVGLVLVDSAHPEMGARLLAALPPEAAGEPKGLQAWREYGTWLATSDGRGPMDVEGVDLLVSNEQVRAVESLGNLPLVVISRSPNNPILAAHMPSLPEEINIPLLQMWQELQAELEGLSTNSTRYVADHSGHNVMLEEPRLVVEAIRQVVDEYRAKSGEPIPPVPNQTATASHAPVILSITQREEWQNGIMVIYQDISFRDPAGDAITVINKLISASEPSGVADDIIWASAEEQKQGALLSSYWGCTREVELVIEYRVFDAAGNMSAPETVTFSCPAPKAYISPSLIVGIVLGMFMLGLAIWLLVRYRRSRRAAVTSV